MSEILERGDVYFLYRPRVDEEEPSGLEDVQRLPLVLQPERQERVRTVIVGRKFLPEVIDRVQERHWAFVARVAPSGENLRDELDREDYRTGRGEARTQPAARAVAEGVYALVRHGDHTHLAYRLELPDEPREVQAELRIAPEASYVVAVKNPDAPVDPPDFLDIEGTELVLVSASADVEGEHTRAPLLRGEWS